MDYEDIYMCVYIKITFEIVLFIFFLSVFCNLTHKIQQMFDGLSFQNKAIKTSIKK